MARLGLGCFLETISMVALFMLVVLPVLPFFEDSEFFDNLLKPILCPDGEIRREQYQTYDDDDGTGYNMSVFCEDSEGDETEVTGNWIGIAIATFIIPFLIGLFLMINGFNKGVRGVMGSVPSIQGYTVNDLSSGFGSSVQGSSFSAGVPTSSAGKTMSQKLKELEDAKAQGLINELEYQKARGEILNG